MLSDMSDDTPITLPTDNLWKRIAIAATACVLFVVLASSFTPDATRADQPHTTNPGDTPTEMPIRPGDMPNRTGETTPSPQVPERAIGDVAANDSDILGTIEGRRYCVQIHASVAEPLYSVIENATGQEVASMMTASELRASFPELRDVQRALPDPSTNRTQLMLVDPNDI